MRTSAPIGIIGLLVAVYEAMDVLVLSKLGGLSDVAYYSAAQRLIWPMLIGLSSIGSTLYPIAASYWPRERDRFELACQRGVDTVVVLAGFAICAVASGAEFFMGILGSDLVKGAPALRILACLCFVKAITSTVGPLLYVVDAQKQTLQFIVIAVLAKLAALMVLAPQFGYLGVAFGALGVEICFSIYSRCQAIPPIQRLSVELVGGIENSCGHRRRVLGRSHRRPRQLSGRRAGRARPVRAADLPQWSGQLLRTAGHGSLAMEDRMKNRSMPRVALISVGLGRVQRGFERWCGDLYGVLRGELDCTLYRSAGATGRGERVPPFLGSANAVFRRLPLSRGEISEYKRDCAAFGFSLLPELLFRGFDVIHCVDPPMAQVLRRIQTSLSLPGRILFTEGSSLTGADLPRVDHLHLVSQVAFDQVLAHGIPPVRSDACTLRGPHRTVRGKHRARRIAPQVWRERKHLRGACSECAPPRTKRVDYIIDEVAKLDGDVLLWLDGHVEDADLPAIAARKLGSRCRVTHVPSNRVAELYGLADVMVQASLNEAFGLSVVEALSSGVMVLAHQSPHFEWLVGDRDCLLDMSQPGRSPSVFAILQPIASLCVGAPMSDPCGRRIVSTGPALRPNT